MPTIAKIPVRSFLDIVKFERANKENIENIKIRFYLNLNKINKNISRIRFKERFQHKLFRYNEHCLSLSKNFSWF
jgi:hypothetical protein